VRCGTRTDADGFTVSYRGKKRKDTGKLHPAVKMIGQKLIKVEVLICLSSDDVDEGKIQMNKGTPSKNTLKYAIWMAYT
jgi:hypothetical protein